MISVAEKRREIIEDFFPSGIPKLWCPVLAHYDKTGGLDKTRMTGHLKHLCKNVRTFLLFGSTGDGWELSEQEKLEMQAFYSGQAARLGFQMLIGVLKSDVNIVVSDIRQWLACFQKASSLEDPVQAMKACRVCGFTVCAPHGADIPQQTIADALEKILQTNVPTVLYQLPQITQNEISPGTIYAMAEKYPNFYMFKDTSGSDKVVLERKDYGGVFFMRGSEGDYGKWSIKNGGYYDGFLLSSANCFASELAQVLALIEEARFEEAERLSGIVSGIVDAVFKNTAFLEGGNVFANANKCIDHIFAYGKDWKEHSLPMRHCRKVIPAGYIDFAGQVLAKAGLLTASGYMAE